MTIKRLSHSPDDTRQIGETIGQRLKGNEIIFLKGELGAGKTLLTKGIANALGIPPHEVVSPTFTLVNEFPIYSKGEKEEQRRFFHVDLYRLGPCGDHHLPEIDDYIDEGVIVVEWAQFLHPSYFKLKRSIEITILLSEENENTRIVEIKTNLKLKIPNPG